MNNKKKREGKQVKVGESIKRAIWKIGKNNPKAIRAAQAQTVWESIAPAAVLSHTDNVYLLKNNGIKEMIIYVDSSLWAADLSAQAESYRLKIQKALQEEDLERVRFIVSSLTGKKKAFNKQINQTASYIDTIETISLTEGEIEKIKEEMEYIDNKQLKETILHARIRNIEWQRALVNNIEEQNK